MSFSPGNCGINVNGMFCENVTIKKPTNQPNRKTHNPKTQIPRQTTSTTHDIAFIHQRFDFNNFERFSFGEAKPSGFPNLIHVIQ